MKAREAIKEINRWTRILMCAGSQCTLETAEAQKMAIEALEKQIPKKIVHNPEAGRETDWTCPACKWTCSPYARHCQNCGQALCNEEYGKD